jgi:hypothetical protein
MKHKCLKKIATMLLAFSMLFVTLTTPISAHDRDTHTGVYSILRGINVGNLNFAIMASAENSVLTLSLYQTGARSWNNISSRVRVNDITRMTAAEFNNQVGRGRSVVQVTGVAFAALPGGGTLLGRVVPTRESGATAGMDENWYDVRVEMNSNASVWSANGGTTAAIRTERARHTFVHEVGHVLKLRHPFAGDASHDISGHTIRGLNNWFYPRALMNQGFPNTAEVSPTITDHDRLNLRARWGA